MRTILVVQLERDDPHYTKARHISPKKWCSMNIEIARCYLTNTDALTAAVSEHKTGRHPGYPKEAVKRMMEARHAHPSPH